MTSWRIRPAPGPTANHLITTTGNGGCKVFLDIVDREAFLDLLDEEKPLGERCEVD
jgi:hypothetical protein